MAKTTPEYISPDYTKWTKEQKDEECKKEILHVRKDDLLNDMLKSHEDKLEKTMKEYDIYKNYPDKIYYEIEVIDGVDSKDSKAVFDEKLDIVCNKIDSLKKSIDKIKLEKDLRSQKLVDRGL